MKITAKVTKVLPEQGGISSKTGLPWRKAQYIVEERNSTRANTLVIAVFDGIDHRIDRLHLTEGVVYDLFLDAEVSEYGGNTYNNIKCWGANEIIDPKTLGEPEEE